MQEKMSAQSIKKGALTKRIWSLIILLSAMGQIAWAIQNNFYSLFIQDNFQASLSDVALMVGIAALFATGTTILIGAYSDRVGKRKPFICMGMVGWGLCMIVFGHLRNITDALAGETAFAMQLGVLLTIIGDAITTFFGSFTYDSSFNAWVTDITTRDNRGRVEGVLAAMPMLAMLVVFGAANFFMIVRSDGTVTYDYPIYFTIIGIAMIAIAVFAILVMQDSHPKRAENTHILTNIAYGFRPKTIKENPILYLVILAFLIFATALQSFLPYYVLYLRLPYVLGDNYVFIMIPAVIVAALFSIIHGRVLDKIGFMRAVIVPVIAFIVGCVILSLSAHVIAVLMGSVLMYCGYLGGYGCFCAEIRNHTPLNRAGIFQGVRMVAMVLVPMIVGPQVGSALSYISAHVPLGVPGDTMTPGSFMFFGGAVVCLLVFIVLRVMARFLKKANI